MNYHFVPMAAPVENAGLPLGAHLACPHGRLWGSIREGAENIREGFLFRLHTCLIPYCTALKEDPE